MAGSSGRYASLFIPSLVWRPSGQASYFHNWMYELGLLDFGIHQNGANIVMCGSPYRGFDHRRQQTHRSSPTPLYYQGCRPMVMTAMIAEGVTVINNADSIHRGYPTCSQFKDSRAKIEELTMVDITNLNTLGVVPVSADELVEINTLEDIKQLILTKNFMFLWDGSQCPIYQRLSWHLSSKINLQGKNNFRK